MLLKFNNNKTLLIKHKKETRRKTNNENKTLIYINDATELYLKICNINR